MGTRTQEWLALSIVGLTALGLFTRLIQKKIATTLAAILLKQGHVKWAMWLRRWSKGSGCC